MAATVPGYEEYITIESPIAAEPAIHGMTPTTIHLSGGHTALVVHDFLTADECDALIRVSSEAGFSTAGLSKRVRNCGRVILDCDALADTLFLRIKPHLDDQATMLVDEEAQRDFGVGTVGTWNADGLNPRFRSCKYDSSGHFGPHADGIVVLSPHRRSFLTFMIYLDSLEPEHGGATRFLTLPTSADTTPIITDERDRLVAAPHLVEAAFQPRKGSVIVFQQATIFHDGEPLRGGEKHIFRSDVMFTRDPTSAPALTPELTLALDTLNRAIKAEADGDFQAAMKLYSRAYKLDPALERAKMV